MVVPLSMLALPTVKAAEIRSIQPSLQATSAVLMDEATGQILYAKNSNEKLYPASITKIMTAMLALEHGKLTDTINTSAYAASQEPNKVYLVPGEKHSLKQMLYGLLIDSGNDAAVTIAEHYGGSVAGFAKMMNQKAASLGAVHTHFVNPNGLQNSDHYTSAYDMALIARAAMTIPEFRTIVDTKYYAWKGQEWQSYLSNLNQMLWWYPGATGVKTGFTDQAEQTIVVTATHGNLSLLAVLMHVNGLNEVQQEAGSLLDYGFHTYHTAPFLQKGEIVAKLRILGKTLSLVAAHTLTGAVKNFVNGHPRTATLPIVHDTLLSLSSKVRFASPVANVPSMFSAFSDTLLWRSLHLLRIHPGEKAGTIVGQAHFTVNYAPLEVPVVIAQKAPNLPAPPQPTLSNKLPWPSLGMGILCLLAALLGKRTRRSSSRNRPDFSTLKQ